MAAAPLPANESQRLEALHAFGVLDTLPEQGYDDIVFLASRICESPIALMSLVDRDRQWFKARVGLDACETSRDSAFCAHAILEPDRLFVVEDATQDERFVDNELVTGQPNIRFYVGAPLVTAAGDVLGTLCVIDRVPRRLSDEQSNALAALSRQVIAQLELRRSVQDLHRLASDLQASRALLERSNNDLERFAYVAAHDLKQPFRTVASFSQILADELSGGLTDTQRKHFDFVTSNASRGMVLIDDLLAFARLNGSHGDAGAWIDMDSVFDDCAAAQDCPHAVVTRGQLPALFGDASQLRQLANNLVGNGLKYNDSVAPTVRVEGGFDADGAWLAVSDNGIGIDDEHRDDIFGMFSRLHDNTTYQGTGIGLAICQRVMELHEGSIVVARSDATGTTFECRFPTCRARYDAAEAASGA